MLLTRSTGDSVMVNPSCHMHLGKSLDMAALPYPVGQWSDGDLRAFILCSAGRAKKRLACNSTSSMRLNGIPWFFNRNAPHSWHAEPTSSTALECMRSMTGNDCGSSISELMLLMTETPSGDWRESGDHVWDSGRVLTEEKSMGLICWRWRGRSP